MRRTAGAAAHDGQAFGLGVFLFGEQVGGGDGNR